MTPVFSDWVMFQDDWQETFEILTPIMQDLSLDYQVSVLPKDNVRSEFTEFEGFLSSMSMSYECQS